MCRYIPWCVACRRSIRPLASDLPFVQCDLGAPVGLLRAASDRVGCGSSARARATIQMHFLRLRPRVPQHMLNALLDPRSPSVCLYASLCALMPPRLWRACCIQLHLCKLSNTSEKFLALWLTLPLARCQSVPQHYHWYSVPQHYHWHLVPQHYHWLAVNRCLTGSK